MDDLAIEVEWEVEVFLGVFVGLVDFLSGSLLTRPLLIGTHPPHLSPTGKQDCFMFNPSCDLILCVTHTDDLIVRKTGVEPSTSNAPCVYMEVGRSQ